MICACSASPWNSRHVNSAHIPVFSHQSSGLCMSFSSWLCSPFSRLLDLHNTVSCTELASLLASSVFVSSHLATNSTNLKGWFARYSHLHTSVTCPIVAILSHIFCAFQFVPFILSTTDFGNEPAYGLASYDKSILAEACHVLSHIQ